MQDLMIDRSITWRVVNNTYTSSSGGTAIPPNPSRVALMAFEAGVGNAIGIYLVDAPPYIPVNAMWDAANAANIVTPIVTRDSVPGLTGLTLYTSSSPASVIIWEAVTDTPLGRAVESMYNELVGR